MQHVADTSEAASRNMLCRYSKLRLWDMADEFDLLLYMDCDMIALGRIEAALDIFAPSGVAPQPLGVARDMLNKHASFNTGVMAIQPDHVFFTEMMAAGRNGSVVYDGRSSGDQIFLNTWLNKRRLDTDDPAPQRYSWVELPPACNVLVAMARWDMRWFYRHWPNALVLHFAGTNSMLKVRYSALPHARCLRLSDLFHLRVTRKPFLCVSNCRARLQRCCRACVPYLFVPCQLKALWCCAEPRAAGQDEHDHRRHHGRAAQRPGRAAVE